MTLSDNIGMQVHVHLKKLGCETPMLTHSPEVAGTPVDGTSDTRINIVMDKFATIMEHLGLDISDDSLKNTPRRVAKMYIQEIFSGLDYGNFPKCSVFLNKMRADEMICVRDIQVRSTCEHHFQPFIGKAHIAYIPRAHIMGLSKFNRIVDFFCRRPQVQERLTEQVAAALRYILRTDDIAVVIEAEHFCVRLRGCEDHGSSTVTSKLTGAFREKDACRNEFLLLTQRSK